MISRVKTVNNKRFLTFISRLNIYYLVEIWFTSLESTFRIQKEERPLLLLCYFGNSYTAAGFMVDNWGSR